MIGLKLSYVDNAYITVYLDHDGHYKGHIKLLVGFTDNGIRVHNVSD